MSEPAVKTRALLWRIGFGITTFVLLVLMFNPREIGEGIRRADLRYFLLAFFLCVGALVLRAWRWHGILRRTGQQTSFLRVLETYVISYWFNTFLPGSVGGDVFKVYDVSRGPTPVLHSIGSVVIERMTGLLALLTIATASILLFGRRMAAPSWLLLAVVVPAVLGAAGLAAAPRLVGPVCRMLRNRIPTLARRIPEQKIDVLSQFFDEAGRNRALFAMAYVSGLALQTLVLGAYAALASALGKPVPFVFFFMFFPLVEVASMIPVTVNGLGVREALTVLFLKCAKADPSFAMGLSILYRLILLVLALIGGAALVLRRPAPRP